MVYFKLAFMIFNEQYWKEKDMLTKASNKKAIATTWLYHAMHYVCGWRSVDFKENMPHLSLSVEPEEIIKMVKDYDLYETNWITYANEFVARVGFENEKPHKTERYRDIPNLKMYIPESYRSTVGMLLALCEAHSIQEGKGNSICRHPKNAKYAVALFGNEYKNLFEGKWMSNRKANKAFMGRIMERGDKNNYNGYLIASYARSHKGKIGSLSEVTSKYLKAKMDGYDADKILRILFERGVCSFVPYLLCSALDNEFERKNIGDQTEIMKELRMSPYDIESLLKADEKVELKVKNTISELIKYLNEDNATEIVQRALSEIADGKCSGKNEGVYCLRIAFGEECCEPKREHCIGCGPEMYLKAFLNDLHNVIIADSIKANNAKTKAEKFKWNSILEKKLYPAVYEVLMAVKYIYKQDITEYQKMFIGGDFNDNVSIDQSV